MLTLAAQPLVELMKTTLKSEIADLKARTGRAPHLSVILVGEDPASQVYVGQKAKMAAELGMTHETIRLNHDATAGELKKIVGELNSSGAVDGILIQRPVPIRGLTEEELVYWIDPEKDVDCFHPENVGRLFLGLPGFQPCTPAGVMALLRHYGIDVKGKLACVIGRSAIVGKPMASLLLQSDATVLQAHSRTRNLEDLTRQADILISAIGRARLIDERHVKPGAVVVDVGMCRDEQGKLCGDVDFDAVSRVASAVTPVPGGVGRMTIMMLMENTLRAARSSARGETA